MYLERSLSHNGVMTTDQELERIFDGSESYRVERKRNLDAKEGMRRAICAFANDLPNTRLPSFVVVGQDDDGACAALEIDDVLLQTIANWRSDGLFQPFPTVSVEKRTVRGCPVVLVEVQPSDNTPLRYDGRVWVRVGPTTRQASADEERRLVEKKRWGTLPFDAQGVTEASLADLDMPRFRSEYLPSAVSREVLAENGRSDKAQMRALHLLRPDGTPTNAAMLLLGIDPRRFFPGAYVQFLRIDGTELIDPILDQKEISGALPDQIRQIEELAALNIRTAGKIGPALRREQPDYPIAALRQLLRNALVHRSYEGTHAPVRVTWYSDRVEIQSPGGPYGQVTVDNFGQPNVADYRNPTIAGALKNMGFMERFGYGFPLARDELAKNGNPPLETYSNPLHVLVVVKKQP